MQDTLPEITSLQNPKIKEAIRLNERRERNATGLFLIEGYRELKRAVEGRIAFHSLFICPQFFLGTNENALIDQIRNQGVEVIVCSENVFQKLSYRDRPDGLLAIGVQMQRSLMDFTMKKDPLLIVAEAIEKPGNLGTILRSADAAGVDAVIVCDRCTDIYNPNVVRASVGTLFTLPVIEASSADTLQWLQQQKIKVVAATPSAKQTFTDANLTGGIAIAVGTEQLGLSETWMNSADLKVRIPMHGAADSLNVATATTLLLYEALRQRQ
jgi:TrmH family RNA methyltransferase